MPNLARPALFLLAASLWVAGCAGAPERPAATEFLDPQTAMTVRVVAEPYVYARDVPELAANVRDYLYVGAVETNNMGARKHYLALVSWSTIDRKRTGIAPLGLPERLELAFGDRAREYPLTTHEPRSIGVGTAVLEPPAGYLSDSWFLLPAADLRAFASAAPPSIDVLVDGVRQTYTLWKRADEALATFVEDIPTELQRAPPRR